MIRKDIKEFVNTLPASVTLVVATKYADIDDMRHLLASNINNFGENRVDAFLNKYDALKNENIIWHFIGHLQRNKAKYIYDKIDYLHSLDSLELANELSKRRNKPLKCFVEVNINEETNKNGVKVEDVKDFIKSASSLKNIEIVGLMMMSVKNSSTQSLDEQFLKLSILREQIEKELNIELPYLSMGMSDDYKIALNHKATHIRLGRIIFE